MSSQSRAIVGLALLLILATPMSAQVVPNTKKPVQVVLNGSVQEDADPPTSVPDTRISVAGGPGVTTDSKGQFSLTLTRDFTQGGRVIIIVERNDWVVNDPVDGMWNLPNVDEVQTKRVLIVPKGSMKLWSDKRIQKYTAILTSELAKLKETAGKPKAVSFEAYLSGWAAEYGFTVDQVREAFSRWAQRAEESGSNRAKGLAEFYRKNFEEAAGYFKEAALDKRQRREERDKEETIEEYNDWKDAGNSDAAARKFKEALEEYQEADKTIVKEAFPLEWADLRLSIANVKLWSSQSIEGDTAKTLLKDAAKDCDEALIIYERDLYPVDWAVAQNLLGEILTEQGTRSSTTMQISGVLIGNEFQSSKILDKAIATHEKALEVLTRKKYPTEWAIAQQDLAIVLRERGMRAHPKLAADMFNQATTAMENALVVFTRNEYPRAWAQIQYNRGFGLMEQSGMGMSSMSARELLGDAIAAYKKALEVYTQSEFPREWADVQHGLREATRMRCGRFKVCSD